MMTTAGELSFQLRSMVAADAPAVSRLCSQLGYETLPHEVLSRYEKIFRNESHLLAVAVDDHNIVLGWVHVHGVYALETEPMAHIAALVVDETRRGQGTGRSLLSMAEDWALRSGFKVMSLRSQVHRERAHTFYLSLGFEIAKASYEFRKSLKAT